MKYFLYRLFDFVKQTKHDSHHLGEAIEKRSKVLFDELLIVIYSFNPGWIASGFTYGFGFHLSIDDLVTSYPF